MNNASEEKEGEFDTLPFNGLIAEDVTATALKWLILILKLQNISVRRLPSPKKSILIHYQHD